MPGAQRCAALEGVAVGEPICALDAVYTYGYDSTPGYSQLWTTLTPPASYLQTLTFGRLPDPPPSASCAPPLPGCNDPASIDVADIVRDLADPDVQQAMGMSRPPVYGNDVRPVDGVIFQVLRADGHGFLAGDDCESGDLCRGQVPCGVARLVSDLLALDRQQVADPSCASLAPTR